MFVCMWWYLGLVCLGYMYKNVCVCLCVRLCVMNGGVSGGEHVEYTCRACVQENI